MSNFPSVQRNIVLSDIAPHLSSAFSPNLHQWATENASYLISSNFGVYRVREGTKSPYGEAGALYVGMVADGDLLGSQLLGVLCYGKKERTWCYVNFARDLEQLEDFWPTYVSVGRCAIDPEHRVAFIDDRWRQDKDRRTCTWCGVVQLRSLVSRTVVDEVWA